jgi:phytoene dehydrogenase-like protein
VRYDALIVGAGMSGLAAGIRLAHFGKRVAILERHYLFGGLNSFYKLAGRRFDSGLHALTNAASRGPLALVLRQLRIPREALLLGEQEVSEICFRPGGSGAGIVGLAFSNDPELLASEVAREFPGEVDALRRLFAELPDYHELGSAPPRSTRAELERRFRDPLLRQMLVAPACWYGAAGERDLPWDHFGVLLRSIFLEGLARPAGGIKTLLDLLVARYREAGGELCLRQGVARILSAGGRAAGVLLEDGRELRCERVFSSAGLLETLRLAGEPAPERDAGVLSFLETQVVMDRPPAELGHRAAVSFANDGERFAWERPEALTDVRSAVIACPGNYRGQEAGLEGLVRVTVLADHRRWAVLDPEAYAAAKAAESERALDAIARFAPDPRPHEVLRDVFTPRTIERFTSHLNGAVYGSPVKRHDGRTPIEGLYLIGTDQGLVGVVGALVSGIAMANRYGLSDGAPAGSAVAASGGSPA